LTKLLRGYSLHQLQGDAFGGLIAALIALPYGLAMAQLMGLPPVLGLFTSIISAPITTLLGRNPLLIGGTSSVTLPFIAKAVADQGIGGAAKVCLTAGVFMMAFSVLRLGRHVAKVPIAVVSGFSCGIGALMIITQMRTIFGLKAPEGGWAESMLGQLFQVLLKIGETQYIPLVLALVVILLTSLTAKYFPRVPAPITGILGAVGVYHLFHWHQQEVGTLPVEVPPFQGFQWLATDVYTVLPAAFGLAFVTSVNILLTSRVVEHFRGRHAVMKKTDADGELGAYGIANIVGGMFAAPMSVGIPARSVAAIRCGATTRMANVFHCIALLLFLTLAGSFVSHVPIPALAGVTAWMGFCLLDWGTWRRLPKMRRSDAAGFLVTAFGVLITNAVFAVAAGCSIIVARHYIEKARQRREAAAESEVEPVKIPALQSAKTTD
jgi:MFS superfamily sulfate permease-like transporter